MIYGLGYLDKKVTIPVKVVNGKLEYFYGGELPDLVGDAIGDLILPIYAIKDETFLKTICKEEIVDFLPKETELFVSMSIDNFAVIDNELKKFLISLTYIPIFLLEDLKLRFRGTKIPELVFCKCFIPAINTEAKSLNQAYSLISQQYEIHRMSHTGNAFTKIFIKRGDYYIPLSDLRDQKDADYEKENLLNSEV